MLFILETEEKHYIFGLLNSKVLQFYFHLSLTINYEVGHVKIIPVIYINSDVLKDNIRIFVKECVKISKPTGIPLKHPGISKTPLLTYKNNATTIEEAFHNWSAFAESQFNRLKQNEEELNRIFIDIYELQDELTPEVENEDVTISKADRERDIKSFISYAVGCMFGRYSLDVDGLVYAGGAVGSGQLAVDSKIGDSGQGQGAVDSGKWIVERIITGAEDNESSKLSAVNSLAEIHGFSGEDLSCDEKVSQRRNVFADQPITKGSGFHTVEHSRRTGTKIDSGISKILNNCPRFTSGSRDANNDCPAFKLCESRRNGRDFKANERNYEDDIWANEQSKITAHCPLSTIHFLPKIDNIIPIADGDYFEDDILERFTEFVKVSFGEETLEENLNYIAEILGLRAGETPRQAIRRYFLRDFYKDHVRTYKKRPIYWLFNSGRGNGFKALIYMHRYDPYTVARVRTDYLHKLQKKYEAEMNHLDILIDSNVSSREKAAARKRKENIRKQLQECRAYDQAIAHVANQRVELDLDDGVKVNYAKFLGVEIPQGEGKEPLKADLLAKI